MKTTLGIVLMAFVIAGMLVSGTSCEESSTPPSGPESIIEPPIPSDFSTYTKEAFFSISYPSDWEPAQSFLEEVQALAIEELILTDPSLDPDAVNVVFVGGLPILDGWYPGCSVAVTKRELGYRTLEEIVEAETQWSKEYAQEYRQNARVETMIGGNEAAIIDDQDYTVEDGTWRYLTAWVVRGDLCWIVNCSAELGDFDGYEDVFYDVVRSFRPLN